MTAIEGVRIAHSIRVKINCLMKVLKKRLVGFKIAFLTEYAKLPDSKYSIIIQKITKAKDKNTSRAKGPDIIRKHSPF